MSLRSRRPCAYSALFGAFLGVLGVAGWAHAASAPDWVRQRPDWPDHYVGIGTCDFKGVKPDAARALARSRALADLCAAIAVQVSAESLDRLSEIGGVTRADAEQTIRSRTEALLSGHEMIGEWEDRRACWAGYRLARATYRRQIQAAVANGTTAARDLVARARGAADPIEALRFELAALAALDPLLAGLGDPDLATAVWPVLDEAQSRFYVDLGRIEVSPGRAETPILAGAPIHEPILVRQKPAGLPAALAALCLADAPADALRVSAADARGVAFLHADAAPAALAGRALRLELDLAPMWGDVPPSPIIAGVLRRAPRPGATVRLVGCADAVDFAWRQAVQGFPARVSAAWSADGRAGEWGKMRHEAETWLQGKGARGEAPASDPAVLVRDSERWQGAAADSVRGSADALPWDLSFVAAGRWVRRANPKSGGEDVRFEGEVRIQVRRGDHILFYDRFQALGGFNPMGEAMALDVLALNTARKWRADLERQLTGGVKP